MLCVGSANLDHVVELDELPAGEDKQLARAARWSGGGIAATAAVAVSALGARASWCGLLGDDNAGRMVAAGLERAGVFVSPNALVAGALTPTAVVLVDGDGRRWLGWHQGDGLDVDATPPQLPDLDSVGAVLADLSSGAMSVSALGQAAVRGLPRVLDMEAADADSGHALTELADHIVFSADGLRRYTGISDVDAALTMAAGRLPHATVGVTLGPRGSA